nr:retrovirus-related Pol polyprotein from transposon TNT 1-94 [Tanacetum cinerariifolium]
MEMAVEQNCAAKSEFQSKMETVLKENDLLLNHALSVDIVNIVVNNYMNINCLTVDALILKLKEKIKSLRADDKENKLEDIETQNLELDHRVTKLTAENNHLKQTYKQLFDSIKSSRVQSKEQCDDLIKQVNLKSIEVADLNASLQERVLVITALKEKLKGKAVSLNSIDPAILQVDAIPLVPKLRKNRTAHIDYLNLSTRPTIVEALKELPKVSIVNLSLKKIKFHLASFDVVVKERTTTTAITEGTYGFEHTKACFIYEIIPFVKALKDLFNSFDQFLIDELTEVQNAFN